MLAELREANRKRQKEWGGNSEIDVPFRALEVAGEAGELSEAVKKYLRHKRGITGSTASIQDIADEMADVIISLDLLADDLGIELDLAVSKKFNKTSSKYNFRTRLEY